jgi:hypothetical protein
VPEGFDFLDEKSGEGLAKERAIDRVEPGLESGDLVDAAPQLGSLLEETLGAFRQLSEDFIKAGEVLGCRSSPGDENGPCPQGSRPLTGIFIDQALDFFCAGLKVKLGYRHEKPVNPWKGKTAKVVPSDRMETIKLGTQARPQPEQMDGKIIEAQIEKCARDPSDDPSGNTDGDPSDDSASDSSADPCSPNGEHLRDLSIEPYDGPKGGSHGSPDGEPCDDSFTESANSDGDRDGDSSIDPNGDPYSDPEGNRKYYHRG